MTTPIVVLQPPCTPADEARVRRQPALVAALFDIINAEPEFGTMKVVKVTAAETNQSPDGGIESIVLKGRLENQPIGMVLNYSPLDLQAAHQHRLDHGSERCTISRLVTVERIVKTLILNGYRVKNQYGDARSGHVRLVLGVASGTPGEPFGLSFAIDWGSWLCGYPSINVD